MGTWSYVGQDKAGKNVEGKLTAKDEKDAKKQLRAQNVRIKKLIAPSLLDIDFAELMVEKGFAKAFSNGDLLQFTRQLAIMVNAGVPLMQSLEILYKQQKNASLRNAVKNIHQAVGEGKTLNEAMAEQKGFHKLYCNLVKAGEAGGILDEILEKLSEHLEKQEKTKKQIKSAMMYPSIVTVVGIGVVWMMMVFVVPQMQDMVKDTGQELPFVTTMVIEVSKFLQKWTLLMVPAFITILVLLNGYRKTTAGKLTFDKLFMQLPLFGGVVIKGNLSSFFRTLGTMVSSGVSIVDSLDVCIETIDNVVIGKDITSIRKAVVEGQTLTEPMSKIAYFPQMVNQMVKVGEQTGSIDAMLTKVAIIMEEEVDELIGNMTKLIEPFILVFLGGFVAIILLAMYLPMFQSAGGA